MGDFLGDKEATVRLGMAGGAAMRSCEGGFLNTWNVQGRTAEIQAGVNDLGLASPNSALFGQPLARASWVITIPGASAAPSNADLDIAELQDIVLSIGHQARAIENGTFEVTEGCLASLARY